MMETVMKGSLTALCRPLSSSQRPSPNLSPALTPATSSSSSTTPSTKRHRDPSSTEMKTITSSTTPSPVTSSSSPTTTTNTKSSYSHVSPTAVGMFPGPNNKCLIAFYVAPFLDETSLVALMRTCRRMREIGSSDEVWEVRLKDMRVNVILVNRTAGFFRAFRSDIITLRGLEGFYDFESEETESDRTGSGAPVSAVKRVVLVISPAFLGFVTPVARTVLIVQYFGMQQEDVFEGTMRYSFPKRLFVMSTFLTRAARQEGPRFDVVVARSVRKWGTQKPTHFESVRGGTRLIISIAQAAQAPANGYLPSNELLTVSRLPREGEGAPPPLPLDAAGSSGGSPAGSGGGGGGSASAAAGSGSSPPTSEKRFSFRSFLGR